MKSPKSRNGYRTVALSTLVLEALSVHIEAYGTGDHELVFHTHGRAIGRSMASQHVRRAVASAGLDGRSWHDLRHYHASVLLSNGVSPCSCRRAAGP